MKNNFSKKAYRKLAAGCHYIFVISISNNTAGYEMIEAVKQFINNLNQFNFMGFIKDNDLTDGISGRVGNKIVFRTIKGVTIATRRPKPTETPITEKQTTHRENFKRAAAYAKKKMLDPVAKEEYLQMAGDKAFHSAFSEAVRDYMVAPTIESIDVNGFTGAAGSIIPIRVTGVNKVVSMAVTITDAANNIIETGAATPDNIGWVYITTVAVAPSPGVKITATAKDRPGKETTLDQIL